MVQTIKAERRESSKRSDLSALRNGGYIPAVVYGYQLDNVPVAVSERDLMMTLREVGRNGVIRLEVEGKPVNVILNDYQADVLKGDIRHADFLAINMDTEMEAEVTVTLSGDENAPGVKEGGTINQPLWTVHVKAKPSDMPETLEVDVSGLQVGETLTVGDVKEKWGVEVADEDDTVLVTITAPRTQEELDSLDEAPAEASAEPASAGNEEESGDE
ncbi:50S ribosomal protein L25/general stress protein Ctc [Edaphobacillus lindanitolerans]|uniref:Large ribosomal subunit protein bL25 n=1 Tax=Edaphobacillus lindanitolerans TaxID=550447 RepID=A0A1U7PRG9_9BACI|nr:50S ribosomal protein L25/general stress protein Ctc [Edaphobacillus lindanitolerans]SIT93368.1 large subunit ribosomal protein L25 [Edaphobacillus lindanitolerans]